MLFGYMRVSTTNQDSKNGEARQREILLANGVEEQNLYYDVISGKDMDNRKALNEMKKYLREGDVVVISELSRLGRNTAGTIKLIEEFQEKGVGVHSVSEKLTIDDSPMGRCFTTIVLAFAQMERELINERCQIGREIAKREGKMGRKRVSETKADALDAALVLFEANTKSVREITEITGIAPATLYREAKKKGIVRK